MNPARSLGPAIVWHKYRGIWVYLLAPVAGAVAGAWVYNVIRYTNKPIREITKSASFLRATKGCGSSNWFLIIWMLISIVIAVLSLFLSLFNFLSSWNVKLWFLKGKEARELHVNSLGDVCIRNYKLEYMDLTFQRSVSILIIFFCQYQSWLLFFDQILIIINI